MILAPDELAVIERQATEEYPHEACGVILVRGDERRLLCCRNAYDDKHAEDPKNFPRDARTAYYIADADRLAMVRLEREGWVPVVIYHSHVDVGAYFSETDKRQALFNGEPHYPDATYVVVSVVERRVAAVNGFRWDAGRRDFLPVELFSEGGSAPLPSLPPEGCAGEAGGSTSSEGVGRPLRCLPTSNDGASEAGARTT